MNKTVIPRTVRIALNEVPIQRRGRNREKKKPKNYLWVSALNESPYKMSLVSLFFLIHFKINFYISVHNLLIGK